MNFSDLVDMLFDGRPMAEAGKLGLFKRVSFDPVRGEAYFMLDPVRHWWVDVDMLVRRVKYL